ncbi:MAG: hypothetical protein BGO12_22690 [Verrucomicrobia bacterium 61-8]|mgnify:CR=1 FL=1|nr:hypothetical protein [Verrucomicrobiota bacterium]OJU98500.1 MAG: hypothetical protein BGO12_22690 [Verrucomicrobia bacterium 61-8]
MRVAVIPILVLAAFISSGRADDIQKFIAGLDWQKDRLESVRTGGDADFIVSVAFEKKDVWRKDTIAIGIRAVDKNDPRFPALAGTGWGGTSGSRGIGSLTLRQINSDGFQAHLELRWTDKVKGNGTFDQTFQCRWADHQSFETDGFKIEVTIKPNRQLSSDTPP